MMNRPAGTGQYFKNNLFFIICLTLAVIFSREAFAQEAETEFILDPNSSTVVLPAIFRPNIDLSGRGFNRQGDWPQGLASKEVIDIWQKDLGFSGIYRLQYNLWEISQLAKDKQLQEGLLSNYESIIKNISDSGGIVILNLFSTPAGLGKVLDKRSPPWDEKAFKELIKSYIRYLSCEKKYNIWYEVWNSPDLGEFFLGKKPEYFLLYRIVAESAKELEAETKIRIPVGGPSVSWWFQNLNGNTIFNPEGSLIYELIKFCYRNRLPLDFISWHGYSTDPKAEKEATLYKKTAVTLIREWLVYFRFNSNIPLVIDEWNYDCCVNLLQERGNKAYIAASYIPARLKGMRQEGVSHQVYFSLEDFQNNPEGVIRNVGAFWLDDSQPQYKGGSKCIYNTFRMLAKLGDKLFVTQAKPEDDFLGVFATKGKDYIAILAYNYVDPYIARNYLSKNIAGLNSSEIKSILTLIQSYDLNKILNRQMDIESLRVSKREKTLLTEARKLNDLYLKLSSTPRNLKIEVKNLKNTYIYERYVIDASCALDCAFLPVENKEVVPVDLYQEKLVVNPYSVQLIVLKEKPKEPEPAVVIIEQSPANNTIAGNVTN